MTAPGETSHSVVEPSPFSRRIAAVLVISYAMVALIVQNCRHFEAPSTSAAS